MSRSGAESMWVEREEIYGCKVILYEKWRKRMEFRWRQVIGGGHSWRGQTINPEKVQLKASWSTCSPVPGFDRFMFWESVALFFSSSFSFWTNRFLLCRHISLGCQPDWLPTDFAWLPFPCLVLWYQTFLNCLSVSLSLFPKSAFGSASSGNCDIYQTSLSTVSPISAFVVVTKAGMTTCKLPLKKGLNSRPRASPPLERLLWMLQ